MYNRFVCIAAAWRPWVVTGLVLFAIFLGQESVFAQGAGGAVDDGSGPLVYGVFAIAVVLVMLAAMLILIGVGIVIGGLAVILGCGLATAGVISTSILVGVLRKSPADGFRALFIQVGLAAGAVCGAGVVLLAAWLGSLSSLEAFSNMEISLEGLWGPALGALAGMLGGLLVAILFNIAWGRVGKFVALRLEAFAARRAAVRQTASITG